MKKLILLVLIITAGCQTTKIKNTEYKISEATTELGSIGEAKSMYNINNDFTTHSYPLLQNKIRLDVQVLPFNADINKIYIPKSGTKITAIKYTDSLAVKPEYVTLNILDRTGFADEINADYNKNIANYLKDTEKTVIVTGIAIALPAEDIAKIKLADTYYLVNNQEKKYTIALYKAGKRTDFLELQSGTVLGYVLGKFCWAVNDRQQWFVGDIVKDNKSCKGNTVAHIKKKERMNLFKM